MMVKKNILLWLNMTSDAVNTDLHGLIDIFVNEFIFFLVTGYTISSV